MMIAASTPISRSTGLNGGVQSIPFSRACTVYAKWKWEARVLKPFNSGKRSLFV